MIGYQTQQRNTLLAFFQAHPDQSFTVDEVTALLRARLGENALSRSTVYRTVAGLEAEQALKRCFLADKRRSAYQYRDPLACAAHLHMRCEACNTVVHLDPEVSAAVAKLLHESSNVFLDMGNTTLVGRCEKCGHIV